MSNSNALSPLEFSNWPRLLDLYALHQSKMASGYILLENCIHWKRQNSAVDIEIFTLHNDWQLDGTFIMHHYDEYYIDTLNSDLERLTMALLCLDKSAIGHITAFGEHLRPAVEKFITRHGFKFEDCAFPTRINYITRSQVEQFVINPPEGVHLAPLELKHATHVNNNWSHRREGSLELIKRLITYSPSVGAFNAQGELMAWSLLHSRGYIGVVHVMDAHKRKGLGSLMVRYMAKKLASMDREVRAAVVLGNTASFKLFEKLGFKVIEDLYWIATHTLSN